MQSLITGTIQQLDSQSGVIAIGALQLRVMPNVRLSGYAVGMCVIATYHEHYGEYWLTGIFHDNYPQSRLTARRAS